MCHIKKREDISFQFLLTASFWLIPSFLWKSSLASEREEDQDLDSLALDDLHVNSVNTQTDLQEKTSGTKKQTEQY